MRDVFVWYGRGRASLRGVDAEVTGRRSVAAWEESGSGEDGRHEMRCQRDVSFMLAALGIVWGGEYARAVSPMGRMRRAVREDHEAESPLSVAASMCVWWLAYWMVWYGYRVGTADTSGMRFGWVDVFT